MRATLFIVFFGISFVARVQSPNDHPYHSTFEGMLEPYLQDFTEKSEISVGMIKGGKTYFSGFNWIDEKIDTLTNHQKVFEIGQMTHVFAAAVLGRYVVDGKVKLNDVVKEKVSMDLKPKVTFGQLASHTAGLDRNPTNQMTYGWSSANPWKDYSEQLLREHFDARIKMVGKPGEKYFESQIGIALLGFALKRIEAIDFEVLVKDFILDKFGMQNTGFDPEPFIDNHATPFSGIGKKTDFWTFHPSIGAMGGMRSTAEDMCRFMQAYFNPSNEDLLMTTKAVADIKSGEQSAMGWKIWTDYCSHPVLFIKGKTAGFSCAMFVSIPKKTGIVLLSNQILSDMEDAMKDLAKSFVN